MAQIELNVIGELKTSTREHKLRWEQPSSLGGHGWTADVGSYSFILMKQPSRVPFLRVMNENNDLAVIDGPEVTSLLRSIEEESKAIATDEKNAELAKVLVTLESHREADRGSFATRS
jgi:hypothetical protein